MVLLFFSTYGVNSAEKKITQLGLSESSTKLLNIGDIIVSARGTVGELAQLSKPMAFNQSCYGIRAKDNLDQNYLYYLLKQKIKQLQAQAHGGVFNTITKDTFERIEVSYPEKKRQVDIAKILGDLDRKIELNRQMNETLEQIGQTLFKKYFVDDLSAAEWKDLPLEEIVDVKYGFAFKSSEFNEKANGNKIVRIRNVLEGDSKSFTTEVPAKDCHVENGDLLVGMDGDFHIGYWSGGEAFLVQRVANFKAREGYSNAFVKQIISDPIKHFNKRGARTTVAHLSAKDIREITFPYNDTVYKKYSSLFELIHSRQTGLMVENRTLIKLRDAILPKLMSGHIEL